MTLNNFNGQYLSTVRIQAAFHHHHHHHHLFTKNAKFADFCTFNKTAFRMQPNTVNNTTPLLRSTLVTKQATFLRYCSPQCSFDRTQTKTRVIWQKVESPSQVHATPRLYSPGGSKGLRVWQFSWEFDPQISPFPWGRQGPHLTVCHWTPRVYLPKAYKSVKWLKQGAQM